MHNGCQFTGLSGVAVRLSGEKAVLFGRRIRPGGADGTMTVRWTGRCWRFSKHAECPAGRA